MTFMDAVSMEADATWAGRETARTLSENYKGREERSLA